VFNHNFDEKLPEEAVELQTTAFREEVARQVEPDAAALDSAYDCIRAHCRRAAQNPDLAI